MQFLILFLVFLIRGSYSVSFTTTLSKTSEEEVKTSQPHEMEKYPKKIRYYLENKAVQHTLNGIISGSIEGAVSLANGDSSVEVLTKVINGVGKGIVASTSNHLCSSIGGETAGIICGGIAHQYYDTVLGIIIDEPSAPKKSPSYDFKLFDLSELEEDLFQIEQSFIRDSLKSSELQGKFEYLKREYETKASITKEIKSNYLKRDLFLKRMKQVDYLNDETRKYFTNHYQNQLHQVQLDLDLLEKRSKDIRSSIKEIKYQIRTSLNEVLPSDLSKETSSVRFADNVDHIHIEDPLNDHPLDSFNGLYDHKEYIRANSDKLWWSPQDRKSVV